MIGGNLAVVDPAEDLTTRLAGAFADLGLRHAVISPGSRSTPLALAFASEPRITSHVLLDERSAGFFAVGVAKQSGVPAALVCTSGTATTNYFPAVVEASHARVPLLVLTADRPPELRGTAAPQTINQLDLYGSAVRMFHDVGVPVESLVDETPSIALRAWAAAFDAPQGPVHLNFPFREPFATPKVAAEPTALRHRRGEVQLPPEDLVELAERLSGRRSLIVAGGHQRPGFAAAAAMFAGEASIPIMADIQCRFPSPSIVVYGDLLASAGFLRDHEPEIIIRIGQIPTSRPIWSWLQTTRAEQIMIDDAQWRDPLGMATTAYRADPAVTFADLSGRMTPTPDSWLPTFQEADRSVGLTVRQALEAEAFPNEPAIAGTVWESAPSGATVYAASSMPIRDLDSFSGPTRGDIGVLSNRGANGIDGLLSASAGAAASDGRRVVVLAGDLSVLHDATALGVIARHELPVTIVAVNNNGGGIFHFLPQSDQLEPERFEALFGTPHDQSLTAIANAFGVPAREVIDEDDLRTTIETATGPQLLEIKTDRVTNKEIHERLRAAVKTAVLSTDY
ncbi:MAG: 2-succinyl-5-enolpyruvyl-6-hydroxy-3-cyclohexene-1-carboxylic-acid synthase [Actinomycetota bacterium]|nr:2-succinyl-5-enolpyruvyl-6-hydroxy-3-cyclohexene-1-carboxylic-acid synthase [Actinomycetota bacterium]